MYVYGTRLRPPDIGCVPRNGLEEVRFERFRHYEMTYWGKAIYSRRLTEEEKKQYDMDYIEEE